MKRRHLLTILAPLVKMDVFSGLGDIGKWIDKMFTFCLVIIILLLILFILWILTKLSGGGARG
jgi:hypothetical protein